MAANKVSEAEVAAFTLMAQEKTGHKLGYEMIKRYARIFVTRDDGRNVFGFIDLTNGNVLRADSWKRPNLTIKNPVQGNVFDEDKGSGSIQGSSADFTARISRKE